MAGTIGAGGNGSLQLKGAGQLARGLKKAGSDLKDLKAVNREAASIVAGEAKETAPHVSGRLSRTVRDGATQKAGVVRAGNKGKVPYAGVINYGWPGHNIKATYFANKAAKDTEPEWTALYSQAVEKIINRITTGDLSK